jgi:hypothetical protein
MTSDQPRPTKSLNVLIDRTGNLYINAQQDRGGDAYAD